MYGQREKRKTAKAMQIHQNKNFHFQFFLHLQRVSCILCLVCISSTRSFTIFSIIFLFPWNLRPCKAIAFDRSNNFLQHERKMLTRNRDNTSFLRFQKTYEFYEKQIKFQIEFRRMASMRHYTKFIFYDFHTNVLLVLEFLLNIFNMYKRREKKLNRRRRMEYHNVEFTQHTSTAPLAM